MAGQLTTHVLDLVLGKGAGGMAVSLTRGGEVLAEVALDDGGRAVVLTGEAFTPGAYEMIFKVGAYHRATGQGDGQTRFLDEVPVRFGVADASGHCHVPLLISLYGYSTYRGG